MRLPMKPSIAAALAVALAAMPVGAEDVKGIPKITWAIGDDKSPVIEKTASNGAVIRAKGGFVLPKGWTLSARRVTLHVTDLATDKLHTQTGTADRLVDPTSWGPIELKGLEATHRFKVAVRATFRDPDGRTRTFETDAVNLEGPNRPREKGK